MTVRRTLFAFVAAGSMAALAACGSAGDTTAVAQVESTVVTVVETTVPEVVTYPLTGLEVTDESALDRPAMVVKIDNHPKARPQIGLNQADIIFEENVEKLTRFAAVFHSQGSDPVGPIRSGRFQDISLVGAFNQPLFVWSGGNAQVTKSIRASDLVDLSFTVANKDGGYARASGRPAPHNLIAETSKLWTLANEGSVPPQQQFEYRQASDANASTSTAVDGFRISMDGVKAQWLWSNGAYVRDQNGTAHVDADDVQLAVANVIVLEVVYSNTYSPAAKTVGSGKAYVFTNGVVYEGTWERAVRIEPWILRDMGGAVIKLTPGRTFVEVARAEKVAMIGPGVDPATVKFP